MQQQSRRTPYDDDYGTCLDTYCDLRVYPGELSPHEITKRLGVEPTEVNVAGEARKGSQGRERILKINGWFLSSEGRVESKDLRRHLDWLLERLQPAARGLAELQSLSGVRMSINCVWWSRSGHGGPTLWPEQMRAMADLNLECTFDVYFEGEDDE